MHKKEREIKSQEVLEAILKRGKFASIALSRRNQPYIVTLSYGYDAAKRALYFHTAREGLKLEFIRGNPRACGTVVEDLGYLQGECAQAFRSVVFFGKVVLVESLDEKKHGFDIMLRHLENDPDAVRKRLLGSDRSFDRAAVLRFDIEEMTGKAGR
jgi:nitroimidazol reductase NimA-like FMN-containing flavoprotein (pyridoxamine 5'-phosphate oxidase superfamily)